MSARRRSPRWFAFRYWLRAQEAKLPLYLDSICVVGFLVAIAIACYVLLVQG